MNIDVREYLRINPISVHELTLSDDDNDCFLFFPTSSSTRGYMALKQRDLFTELKQSILGGLLDYSQDPSKITTEDVNEDAIAGKFKNYVRRSVAKTFMDEFDGKLEGLESDLDTIILKLRRKGVLDYAGAVELQSNNTRKLSAGWTDGIGHPIYDGMSYSLGQIWCKSTDSNIDTTGGSDEVSIGDLPLRHKHPDTKAEALTGPLSDKFGGGQLIGDFTIGSKELVAQGRGFGPTTQAKASPLEHAIAEIEPLTYPLWGQNVLDWRNPKKEHNNIPPSLNIYVRYWQSAKPAIREILDSMEICEEILSRMAEIREAQEEKESLAKSQYDSSIVNELPKYADENLTTHDYILRISSDGGEQIQLMRQGLQMLLDIFATKANKELSTEDFSMQELLMKHLDRLLIPVSEFMQWYNERIRQLDEIEAKIETIRRLIRSVPPLNYIGRIIISFTDDTEQKVIANYGGKSWRRIENFLRGVLENDPENIPGQKLGEEYVALRESNIPIHAHSQTIDTAQTSSQEWTAKNKGGDSKIVNTQLNGSDRELSIGVKNIDRNYQISPLEYPDKEEDEITLPHDNLPPYMKMYIWECTELTDEEYAITGEPKDNKCVVTWLYNGGKVGQSSSTTQQRTIGGNHSSIPTPTYANNDFIGWKDMSGQTKTNEQIIATPISGNETYVAQWKPSELLVTFDSNGAQPEAMKRRYAYGKKIGYFPTMDELPEKAVSLDGWYTSRSGGNKVDKQFEVTDNITLYAHWTYAVSRKFAVKFYHYNESDPYKTIELEEGTRIGDMDNPTRTGYTFKGWFTAKTGGDQVFATKRVYNDLNLYEQWMTDTCTITWNPNYYGCETFTSQREYGSKVGTLPLATRPGYAQDGWWTAEDGGNKIMESTVVESNIEYYAHWNIIPYEITYDLKGGTWNDVSPDNEYYVTTETFNIKTPTYSGRTFLGWTGSNGNTPQLTVAIAKGTTGNKSYVANWNTGTYTVKFNANGGTGTMEDQTFTYDVYQQLRANAFSNSILVSFNVNDDTSSPSEFSLTSYREFQGWATSSSGNKAYDDQQSVKNITDNSEITLYAKWGGFTKIFLPNANRTGYTFAGWYTAAVDGISKGGSGAQYQPTGATTLYAHWTPNFYIIRFNANGGSGTMDDQIVQYGARDQLKTNQFTYDGAAFGGWALSPSGSVRWEDNDTIINLSENLGEVINVYAIWYGDPITVRFNSNWDQYTMNFDANGGVGGWSKRLDAGTQITTPTVTRQNYDFIGWSPTPPTTMPENDVTCTAQWRQQAITAKITTSGNRATCSEVNPPDATVQYSTTNATSGYNNGSTFTLTFASGTTQTKSGWFKISKSGLTSAIYKVSITQTVSKVWSSWSNWTTGLSGNDVAAALVVLKNRYGEGNFQLDVQKISDHHYRARESHVTGTQTSYSPTIEKVS